VPLFYIESEYDSWSLANILGLSCHKSGSLQTCSAADRKVIEEYRTAVLDVIN